MKKALNILLGVLLAVTAVLMVYAVISTHPENPKEFDPQHDPSISLSLIWGYVLFCAAILSAIACAVWGMIKNPKGIRGSLISLVLVVIVIGVAYFISAGHQLLIPDLETGGYFGHGETVISETGILVTYVVGICAVLAAIYSEIANALK